MQSLTPSTPPVPLRRIRGATYVLAGGVLLFVGTALGYTWSLLFAASIPNLQNFQGTLSQLASIISVFGRLLVAGGFLLIFYGISSVLDALLRARASGLSSPPAPGSAVPVGGLMSGVHQSPSPLILAGTGLLVLGEVLTGASPVVGLLWQSSGDVFRAEIGISFGGGVLAAAGFGLAFYGILATLRRLL